jgi:hypothetical protein
MGSTGRWHVAFGGPPNAPKSQVSHFAEKPPKIHRNTPLNSALSVQRLAFGV